MKQIFLIIAVLCFASLHAQDVRIKDVSNIDGLEEIQVYGYGLVVGLGGTGDRSTTVFTAQTIKNMLRNMGIELPDKQIHLKNVAAVMVTGSLTPFKKKGTKIDVVVSSIGDARSLEGGTLLMTSLQGSDGRVYASAQGALSTGGYDVRNRGLSKAKKNHVQVGRIPEGAIVQSEYAFNNFNGNDLSISLDKPDFTSAIAMRDAINAAAAAQLNVQDRIAEAADASTVNLNYPLARDAAGGAPISLAEFISIVENVSFTIAMPARVVMNERTGTVVAGSEVKISEVAVTHGGIKIEIINRPEVVSPQPFTMGESVTVPNPEQVVDETERDMVVFEENATVTDLSQALNSLGVAPRDIISIFQAVKQAGALHGELMVM
ncbi:MAG: flagellar basal body P-ring protein FlgI [Fibrobacterota bacterium]